MIGLNQQRRPVLRDGRPRKSPSPPAPHTMALPRGDAAHEDDGVTDAGIPRMTPEVLGRCCKENGGYTSPELNECLPLQYKGFRKIEGLAPYTGLRSLFLECNGIRRIEGLEGVPRLVTLYLQSNVIEKIENLEGLVELQVLNLSHNCISCVEGLGPLQSLETLKLAANKIQDVTEGLAGLGERPTLKCVDLSCNYIEDGENLIELWGNTLPDIECLYLHHNSCSRYLKDYRRRMISSLPCLRWLDERPVRKDERAGCEAWAKGGKDAEWEAKKAFFIKEKEDKARSFNDYLRYSKAAAARAQAQKEQQEQRDRAREEATVALSTTGSLGEGWIEVPAAGAPEGAGQQGAAASERQRKLKESVRSFLESRRRDEPVEEVACTVAPEEPEEPTTEVVGTDAPEEPGAGCTHFAAYPASSSIAQASQEEVGEAASAPLAAGAAPQPLVWTPAVDQRFGSLLSKHKYNFRLAAEALGAECAASVTASECRKRYRELMKASSEAIVSSAPLTADVPAVGKGTTVSGPDEGGHDFMRQVCDEIEAEASARTKAPSTASLQTNPLSALAAEPVVGAHQAASERRDYTFAPPPRRAAGADAIEAHADTPAPGAPAAVIAATDPHAATIKLCAAAAAAAAPSAVAAPSTDLFALD